VCRLFSFFPPPPDLVCGAQVEKFHFETRHYTPPSFA
jgi:hypothetical protein